MRSRSITNDDTLDVLEISVLFVKGYKVEEAAEAQIEFMKWDDAPLPTEAIGQFFRNQDLSLFGARSCQDTDTGMIREATARRENTIFGNLQK